MEPPGTHRESSTHLDVPPRRDSAAPEDAEALRRLLELCLDRLEHEGESGVESVYRENPRHSAVLRRRVERLRRGGFLEESAPPADAQPAETLGDFRLVRKLGEGGMGVVYLAEQRSLRRPVALKLIRPGHLHFEGTRERFRREIEAVARLQHPGIVPIYVVGEENGAPYFAMERVTGCSLAEALRELQGTPLRQLTGRSLASAIAKRTPSAGEQYPHAASGYVFEGTWEEACLRLARQVADAPEHAHRRGVAHRDVKPANLK